MSTSQVHNLENYQIPLKEITDATNDFNSKTRVGDGGFGVVYKGKLSEGWNNGQLVAIKCLHPDSYQGIKEFNNELNMYSIFNHPNIIGFIGYYDDADKKILVSEYATNRSLDYHLEDENKRRCLTWEQRLKICLGAARGIKYLHSGVGEYERVIHRDMKSANILLDDNLEAKICDFGLSRLTPRNQPTSVYTRAAGTNFYMDPNYRETDKLTKESDIYSFGVVMFEMSSGLMAYHRRQGKYLIALVRSHYEDHVGGFSELKDTVTQIDMNSFNKFNEIAHECISRDDKIRPTIDNIIERITEILNILSPETIYMLGPDRLSIEWQEKAENWNLGPIPGSRFPEVWILEKVYWLEIRGSIPAKKLSPTITYVAYLVFRTNEQAEGLSLPAETIVSFGGIKKTIQNVYLQIPQLVQGNYVLPRRREDGWMEIPLGEFKCDEGDDGDVEMKLKEVTEKLKVGLIV